LILTGIISYILIKRGIEKEKKIQMALYEDTLPKKSPDVIYFGKLQKETFSLL